MNAATIQHLADLKKAGFDVSSLEHQMNASPILNQRGDQLMGGGILRQAAFTKVSQEKADKIKELEGQIAELSKMQGAGISENSPVYKAALEVIAEQQQLLINAGFSEDEVTKLSEKAVVKANEKVIPPTVKETPVVQPPAKKEGEGEMDTSNFLDLDTFQAQSENQIFGSATLAAKIQHKLNRAHNLGIEVPDDKINNLGLNLRTAVAAGKNIDEFLDEDLGISAKQKEVDEAARKKELADERAAGKAEGFKEAGVPRRVVTRTGKHPIYDNITSHRETMQQQEKQDDGNKEIPTNKWGDKEIYRTRGDKFSRIQAAEDYHEKVLERTAAQDSIPSE